MMSLDFAAKVVVLSSKTTNHSRNEQISYISRRCTEVLKACVCYTERCKNEAGKVENFEPFLRSMTCLYVLHHERHKDMSYFLPALSHHQGTWCSLSNPIRPDEHISIEKYWNCIELYHLFVILFLVALSCGHSSWKRSALFRKF